MFANGPQWTNAGCPSSVWTRFGLIASLSRHGHRACRAKLLGGDRLALPRVGDGDLARGACAGRRGRATTAAIAITSEAAVMSKPVSRTYPFARPPRPITTPRSARSFMSTQRRQLTVSGSIPRAVAVQDVRLEHRGQEVVRGADRVDVAGEVEVQILHRHDLRVPAARRAALDPEHRAERRLAQAEHRLAADAAEPLRQPDGRRRLPLAHLGRRDRGDADQLAVRTVGEPVEHGEVDLRLVAAVELDLARRGGRPPSPARRSAEAWPPGQSRGCSASSSSPPVGSFPGYARTSVAAARR